MIWRDFTAEIVHPPRWNRKFRSMIILYIIELCDVKYNLTDRLRVNQIITRRFIPLGLLNVKCQQPALVILD